MSELNINTMNLLHENQEQSQENNNYNLLKTKDLQFNLRVWCILVVCALFSALGRVYERESFHTW